MSVSSQSEAGSGGGGGAGGLTFIQVGVGEAGAQLLDHVDGLQVAGALEAQHGVDGQVGEVVLVVREQLGGQRGAGDVQQVLLEAARVVAAETQVFKP